MSRRDNFNDILTDRRQLSFEITARGEDAGGGHVRSQPRLRRLGVNSRMHSLRDTLVSRRSSRSFYHFFRAPGSNSSGEPKRRHSDFDGI